jgi:hypothetical protein
MVIGIKEVIRKLKDTDETKEWATTLNATDRK